MQRNCPVTSALKFEVAYHNYSPQLVLLTARCTTSCFSTTSLIHSRRYLQPSRPYFTEAKLQQTAYIMPEQMNREQFAHTQSAPTNSSMGTSRVAGYPSFSPNYRESISSLHFIFAGSPHMHLYLTNLHACILFGMNPLVRFLGSPEYHFLRIDHTL